MAEIHRQLMLFGAEALRRTASAIEDPGLRRRELGRIEAASNAMGELADDELAFTHSGRHRQLADLKLARLTGRQRDRR